MGRQLMWHGPLSAPHYYASLFFDHATMSFSTSFEVTDFCEDFDDIQDMAQRAFEMDTRARRRGIHFQAWLNTLGSKSRSGLNLASKSLHRAKSWGESKRTTGCVV